MTSSLEKKAEASAIKSKLEQDSIRIPFTDPEDSETDSAKIEEKRLNRPFVAYDIAASAASYVHSQAEDLSGSHQESNDVEPRGCGAHLQEEEGFSPSRVHKSEMAAYVAASTMTAVVAAGEEEKQKAARDLQSLHSSPCEWFICDDLSAYTRCFVIQVLFLWSFEVYLKLVYQLFWIHNLQMSQKFKMYSAKASCNDSS